MPVLSFLEIPRADMAGGEQDSFELFARDFLSILGYDIESGPDRGPDGGRDLVALETRVGVAGTTTVRWLVSCKHKAYSGNSVTLDDEKDILDRVTANQCEGFIGFYSTLPSSSLTKKLEGLKRSSDIQYQFFDRERIETELLRSSDGFTLAERYFKVSFNVWNQENPSPANLFADQHSLFCRYCQKDLLNPKSGIVVVWTRTDRDENGIRRGAAITEVYWCCKGECDRTLASSRRGQNEVDQWQDIPDLCIPTLYLRRYATLIDEMHGGIKVQKDALDAIRQLMIVLFPFVCRAQTTKENERVGLLFSLP